MKLKLRRSDIILILGFWIIGCALLGTVGYFILYPGIAPPPAPPGKTIIAPQATVTVVFTQVTAKTMQSAAQAKLSQWAADAQLFAVTATWENAALDSVGEPTFWTYRYYSPSRKRFFFITVGADGSVMGTTHGERIYDAPYPIPADDWVVDSPAAVNTWLNYGGIALVSAAPNLQVVAQLQVNEPNAPLQWTVAGYDKTTKMYHTVFIDARSGKVTKITSSLQQQ